MSGIRVHPLNRLTALSRDSDESILVVSEDASAEDAAQVREALGVDPGFTYVTLAGDGIDYTGATDSTAAIHAAIDAAIAGGVYIGEFLSGTISANIILPPLFKIRGQGDAPWWLSPGVPTATAPTIIRPADNDEAAIRVEVMHDQLIESIYVHGFGDGTSAKGIHIGTPGEPLEFAGNCIEIKKVTVSHFTTGIEFNSSAAILLERPVVYFCGIGYDFTANADTVTIRKGIASWCTGSCIRAVGPKSLNIQDGEWGNGAGPLIESSGVGQIKFTGNVESISGDCVFEIDTTDLLLENARMDVANTDLVSYVRQMSTVSSVGINNCLFLGGGTGTHIWEGPNANSLPPRFAGSINGTFRWSSDNTFADTVRVQRSNALFPWQPEKQIINLQDATTGTSSTASITNIVNSGQVNTYPLGLECYTAASAGSIALTNLAKNVYSAAPMMKGGDSGNNTFSWSRQLAIKFRLNIAVLSGTLTSDSVWAIYFGVPYDRTTTGALTARGIGVRREGDSIYMVHHNGTTEAQSLLGTIADFGTKIVTLEYNSVGNDILTGSLQGESIVNMGDGPQGDSDSLSNSILVGAWNTTGAGGIRNLISDLEIFYF